MGSFSSKCDNEHCKELLYSRFKGDNIKGVCSVCLEDLKDGKVAMLSDCDHVFCDECIKQCRGKKWNYKCPYCRQFSNSAIYASNPFDIQLKSAVFSQHDECYKYDPYLMNLMQLVSPEWRGLAERLLKQKVRIPFPYLIDSFAYNNFLSILSRGNKYSVFGSKIPEDEGTQALIYCTLPGLKIQLLISSEKLCYDDPDNDYADEAVEWVNQQLDAPWDEIPYTSNPIDNTVFKISECMVMRKFDRCHCWLYIIRETNYPNSLMTEEIKNMRKCNLRTLMDIEFDTVDKISRFLFLTPDMEQVFSMDDKDYYDYYDDISTVTWWPSSVTGQQ